MYGCLERYVRWLDLLFINLSVCLLFCYILYQIGLDKAIWDNDHFFDFINIFNNLVYNFIFMSPAVYNNMIYGTSF